MKHIQADKRAFRMGRPPLPALFEHPHLGGTPAGCSNRAGNGGLPLRAWWPLFCLSLLLSWIRMGPPCSPTDTLGQTHRATTRVAPTRRFHAYYVLHKPP